MCIGIVLLSGYNVNFSRVIDFKYHLNKVCETSRVCNWKVLLYTRNTFMFLYYSQTSVHTIKQINMGYIRATTDQITL